MILIWAQHGYVVPAIVFLCSLCMELAVEAWLQDSTYYQTEYWPLAVALMLSGLVCRIAGMKLNEDKSRQPPAGPGVIINGQVPEETPVKIISTFVFIRVETWAYLLFAAALGLFSAACILPALPGFP